MKQIPALSGPGKIAWFININGTPFEAHLDRVKISPQVYV